MEKIKFLLDESENIYNTKILNVSKSVIKITFTNNIPTDDILLNGFYIINENNNKNMSGDYYNLYNTLYRKIDDNTFMLSNDGSVYTEPIPIVDDVITEVTEEEKAELERQNQIYNIQSEISTLKSKLDESDYIIIKCQEYILAGKELPDEYDITRFSEERDVIRKQINTLEEELNKI